MVVPTGSTVITGDCCTVRVTALLNASAPTQLPVTRALYRLPLFANGTFDKEFSKTSISPSEAEFAKIQMIVRASFGKPSYFLIDDLKVDEIAPSSKIINR